MSCFETTLLGLRADVIYTYVARDRGHDTPPSDEFVEIDSIKLRGAFSGGVVINPNELHKSQLDALEKEALKHYKERGI